jgi:hypothetical protein
MSKIVKVAVSIPTMGYTDPAAYCNHLANFMHLGKLEERSKGQEVEFQFHLFVQGRIFTPVARDEAMNATLNSDCSYLYMIDDDMICPEDMFERLYAHNVDIVAPLAFTRNPPHKPVLYHCVDGYDPVEKKEYFINNVIMNYPKDTLVECDAVGFGAVLIKRWVLEKIGKKPFMSTCGTGEDILFCYKAKKIGAKTYMDTSCKLGHIGNPINVTEEYVEGYREKNGYVKDRYFEYGSKGDDVKAELVIG